MNQLSKAQQAFELQYPSYIACHKNYEPTKHVMQDALRIDRSDFQFNLNF